MTVVKICGLTCVEDALCPAEAGADLLGFIFYPPSPRAVLPEVAVEIATAVRRTYPAVRLVGVFVKPTAEHVRQITDQVGLDAAQVHGAPLQVIQALAGHAYLSVKAWDEEAEQAATLPDAALPQVLLDASHPTLWGGSGQRADELLARQIATRYRLLLAGGLTPENVAEVIARVRPWGVDVASGVESAPGRKDPGRVRLFVRRAKAEL